MTWETADMEAMGSFVRATKRGAGIRVEEPVKRRGYGMGNYVFAPAAAIGFICLLWGIRRMSYGVVDHSPIPRRNR